MEIGMMAIIGIIMMEIIGTIIAVIAIMEMVMDTIVIIIPITMGMSIMEKVTINKSSQEGLMRSL